MWTDIGTLSAIAKYASWVATFGGLILALAGIVHFVAEGRVSELKEAQTGLIRPRHIDKVTEIDIISALNNHARGAVTVESIDDGEAAAFADALAGTLQNAGWSVVRVRGAIYTPERFGLFLATTREMPAAAKAMYHALQEAHLPIELWWIDGSDPGWEIRVARRPENLMVSDAP